MVTETLDDRPWTEQILELCTGRYLGRDGLLVTSLAADGSVADSTPLIADFGDVLPFLECFGRRDFVHRQIAAARPLLRDALFRRDRRTRLFDNHDWLLGLLELHETTGEREFLDLARDGAATIIDTMFVDDLLVDSTIDPRDLRTWLRPASPFNGGYIELWLDLHSMTGEERFLEASIRLADRWERTPGFMTTGVFHRTFCAWSPLLDRLVRRRATMSALLFKDNTNFVWSLLALRSATGDDRWTRMIVRWAEGFRRHFLDGGDVKLRLDVDGVARDTSLKAAFSAIDLLCDLHVEGVDCGALEMAETIAGRWYLHRWSNGLFPERPGGDRDHLDANVDMVVAIAKLAGLTGSDLHARTVRETAKAVVEAHLTPMGLVQAVGPDGSVRDGRIIVKYQSLALKLALLPDDLIDLTNNSRLLKLLRDR